MHPVFSLIVILLVLFCTGHLIIFLRNYMLYRNREPMTLKEEVGVLAATAFVGLCFCGGVLYATDWSYMNLS